jgi:acyl-CoA-binding protein
MINQEFEKAVAAMSELPVKLPPDTMLKLYAYYKIATGLKVSLNTLDQGAQSMIDAFKSNALFQARNTDRIQAMQQYIDLAAQIQQEIRDKKH